MFELLRGLSVLCAENCTTKSSFIVVYVTDSWNERGREFKNKIENGNSSCTQGILDLSNLTVSLTT